MTVYSTFEFKHALRRVLDEARNGDVIAITRHGDPVAVLLSYEDFRRLRAGDFAHLPVDPAGDDPEAWRQGLIRQFREATGRGGRARAKNLSMERQREIGRMGAEKQRRMKQMEPA